MFLKGTTCHPPHATARKVSGYSVIKAAGWLVARVQMKPQKDPNSLENEEHVLFERSKELSNEFWMDS